MARKPKMTSKQWYEALHRNEDRMNELQRASASAFMEWANNPVGPIPEVADAEALHIELDALRETAPSDKSDDELEALVRSEAFAQKHRDSMGYAKRFAPLLRHTQTRQYHASLTENSNFMLHPSPTPRRTMTTAHEGVLPRPDNPITRAAPIDFARGRMAAALASVQATDPNLGISMDENDYERLIGVEVINVNRASVPTSANKRSTQERNNFYDPTMDDESLTAQNRPYTHTATKDQTTVDEQKACGA